MDNSRSRCNQELRPLAERLQFVTDVPESPKKTPATDLPRSEREATGKIVESALFDRGAGRRSYRNFFRKREISPRTDAQFNLERMFCIFLCII